MLLKSLEIQGFKTFPDKTVLSFDKGITAVVGPNGSGKSNISDAVRWVLGEQSTRILRCSRMEDVIFSGTPQRKGQGYAEVTLNIDNSERRLPFENDTVAVTRRYYRSGESEYLLNKAAVRLKDIHELFMDTGLGRDGYSIIGQGKIDSIVAARSEDRREIFEEAAGISRFRYRKEESEKRLSQSEENLLRLQDILEELKERVGPLKEQAQKAEQYLAYAQERKNLEIGLWLETLNRSGRTLREYEDKLVIVRSQYDNNEQDLQTIENQIEQNFTQSNELTAKMDELRRQAASQDELAVRKDGDISVLKNDIQHNEKNIERIQKELSESANSGENLKEELAQKQLDKEEKKREIAEKEKCVQDALAKIQQFRAEMEKSSKEIDHLAAQISEYQTKASGFKISEMTAASSISEIERRLADIQSALMERQVQSQKAGKEKKEYTELLEQMVEKIHSLTNTAKGYEIRLHSRRQKVEEAKKSSDQLGLDVQEQLRRARLLEELEQNLEGFTHSVKMVMKESARGTLSGILGPVSRLFQVSKEYATAIETALGAAMQNLVVENEQDAKRAIALLKQKQGGRATFLPVSTIRGNVLQEQGLKDCFGFVGIAVQLCQYEKKYEGILNSLLGRIAVAEDLDSAVFIAKKYNYRFRIVTLDGQVVNTGGSLTGGSLNKNAGLLSRTAEIAQIKQNAESLQNKLQKAKESLKLATEEASAAEAAFLGVKGELSSLQEDKIRVDSELKRIEAEEKSSKDAVEQMQQEKTSAIKRKEGLFQAQEDARVKAEQCSQEVAKLQEQVGKLGDTREAWSQKNETLLNEIQETRMMILSAQKDEESLQYAIEEIQKKQQDHRGHIENLQEEIKSVTAANTMIAVQIDGLKAQAVQLRESAEKSRNQAESLSIHRMELEKSSSELRIKEREKSAEREKTGHEIARLEERKANLQKEYDGIISKMWEEYELTRREAEQITKPIEDILQTQKRLNELKGKIKALGNVNVAAVEEYKEVSQRYEFLNAQVADIEKSRNELKKLIGDLTHQMKDLFTLRFDQINQNFVHTFRELFGGGTAGIALSDPDDILTSGIEISVQPPGKIVTHLELLSGGEKALVAIALYFAIMKVNPPPFCVLDEIEAALDDVNVTRFATYLRRMNDNTQFIVITHRRGTMEEADVLYGVTMQDEGISKLLELHVEEIEQRLGMKQIR